MNIRVCFLSILLLFLHTPLVLRSQHCEFDDVKAIIIEVHEADSVSNLTIELSDSTGKKTGTYFWKNTHTNKAPERIDHKNFANNAYWFADSNYILVDMNPLLKQPYIYVNVSYTHKKKSISKHLRISSFYVYPLCTDYGDWTYKVSSYTREFFKPLQLELLSVRDKASLVTATGTFRTVRESYRTGDTVVIFLPHNRSLREDNAYDNISGVGFLTDGACDSKPIYVVMKKENGRWPSFRNRPPILTCGEPWGGNKDEYTFQEPGTYKIYLYGSDGRIWVTNEFEVSNNEQNAR